MACLPIERSRMLGCWLAWAHLKEIVQLGLKQRLRMDVRGGPDVTLEVSGDLKVEQVFSVVRHSGGCPGVEHWAGKPAPGAFYDNHRMDEPAAGTRSNYGRSTGAPPQGSLGCGAPHWRSTRKD